MHTSQPRCLIALAGLLGLLALGGCAVTRDDLTTADIDGMALQAAQAEATLKEPLKGPIDLEEAMARALKLNADIRVQRFAAELAETRVRAGSMSMLPEAVAESHLYGRDTPAYSHSNMSPMNSTSSDVRSVTSDLTLSWSILDFGLAYFRSQQEGDKAAKEREEVRHIAARVLEETRSAYWRTLAFQRLGTRLVAIEPEVKAMLGASSQAIADQRVDPMVSLTYDRDMLGMRRELNDLLTTLAGSPQQLRQLIGVPQDVALKLRQVRPATTDRLVKRPIEDDVLLAFRSRFELRQALYDMRISDTEAYAAVAQALPGISFDVGMNRDSNSFLLNGSWLSWGSSVAWSLIKLARLPSDLDVVEAEKKLSRQQTVALAASIAMQVRVARARVMVLRRTAEDADTLADVQRRLLRQVDAAAEVGTVAPQMHTKEKLATLLAEVRADLAHADLESAVGTYMATIGEDAVPDASIDGMSVSDIAAALRQSGSGLRRSGTSSAEKVASQ